MPLSIESWIGQKFIAITYYKKVSFHLLKNDKKRFIRATPESETCSFMATTC